MTGLPGTAAEGDSLTVRFDRRCEEREGLRKICADREGCVQLALASISGGTLGDVFRAIGDRPTGQDQWWKVHAKRLGLKLASAIAAPNGTAPEYGTMDDLHALRQAHNGWDPASGDPLPMEVYSVERGPAP